jgi:hypothetical protein
MNKRTGLWLLLGVALIAAVSGFAIRSQHDRSRTGATSQGIPLAVGKDSSGSGGLTAAMIAKLDLDPASVRDRGSFSPSPGTEYHVYSGRLQDGQGCVVEDTVSTSDRTPDGRPLHETGTACSPDVFLGHKVAWTLRTERGAPGEGIEYLLGISAPDVARVEVLLSNGDAGPAQLTSDGGFFYRQPADTAPADRIATIVSYNRGGMEIDRMTVHGGAY